ncbi:MAG: ABC transporter permease [Marinilabiliaceae bacterium]|nr:ABC transporter permease [Marinilabiliaceae bacterium]
MILHYIKIAIRNLKKYPVQTTISTISMAVGIALIAIMMSAANEFFEISIENNPEFRKIHYITPCYSEGNYNIDPALLSKFENREFKTIEKYCIKPPCIYYCPLVIVDNDGEEKTAFGHATAIRQEFLDFLYLKSAVTGDFLKPLDDNTVIISESFAQRVFGTINVIGKSISFNPRTLSNDESFDESSITSEHKMFTICDVARINMIDELQDFELIFKTEVPLFLNYCYKIYIIPSEGNQYNELCKEIQPAFEEFGINAEIGYLPWDIHGSNENIDPVLGIKILLIGFAIFIFISPFLGYLRMQLQLFWLRQREIALRNVVGGKTSSLVALFFTEICLVLMISGGLAIAFSSILSSELISSSSYLLHKDNLLWRMSDLELNIGIVLLCTLILCLIIVSIAVYYIRKSQTCLALQMKPSKNHRVRRISLGIQMIFSILFISITIFLGVLKIPDYIRTANGFIDTEKMQECFEVGLSGTEQMIMDKSSRLRNVKEAEAIIPYTFFTLYYGDLDKRPEYMVKNEKYTTSILFQENDEFTNYMEMKVTPVEHSANRENTIYVEEDIYQTLTENGSRPAPTIELFGEMVSVAGTFKQFPTSRHRSSYLYFIWNRDPYTLNIPEHKPGDTLAFDTPRSRTFLVKARRGHESEVAEQLREIRDDGITQPLLAPVEQYKNLHDNTGGIFEIIITLVYLMTFINITSTCSALYSAVSLDVRHRRKEVALRKINGATAKDILKLFAKEYVILLIVCSLIAALIELTLVLQTDQPTILTIQLTLAVVVTFLIVVLIIAIITALTVGWKIREIMYMNPVEGLKK